MKCVRICIGDVMDFLYIMPVGILYVIAIAILLILNKKLKSNSKIIKILLYISIAAIVVFCLFVLVIGFSYSCPCKCGSVWYFEGLFGLIKIFSMKPDAFIVFDILYCAIYIILIIAIICTVKIVKKNKH